MPAEDSDHRGLQAPAPRNKIVTLRLDKELHDAAAKKTAPYGVAATLRALLRAFVRGDVELKDEDLRSELMPAPRKPRKRAK